jgi:uncharacterized hydrophobic protein (TIGR00271 family)
MLQLRAFGPSPLIAEVARALRAVDGAAHVARLDAGDEDGNALVTADLSPDGVDPALTAVHALGVPAQDVSVLRMEPIQSGPLRRETLVVWADLLGQAAEHARPVARYLVFMLAAGVIAGYGVIYANGILIVGAMAVSPDLLPITALCVAVVLRRKRLLGHAAWTLIAGLGCAGLVACVLAVALDATGLMPASFALGGSQILSGLTSVNSSTVMVALVAGAAGMLALETRASAAVGVAISVTTIPASAYLGVAAGVGDIGEASGAGLVLLVNVCALVAGGTLTLLVQRMLGARRPAPVRVAAPGRPARAPRAGG